MQLSNSAKAAAAKRTAMKTRKAAPPPVANSKAMDPSNKNYAHNMQLQAARTNPTAAAAVNASRAKETKKRNTMAVNTSLNEDLYVGSKGKKGWKTPTSTQRLKNTKKPIWGAPRKGGDKWYQNIPGGIPVSWGNGGAGIGGGTPSGNR